MDDQLTKFLHDELEKEYSSQSKDLHSILGNKLGQFEAVSHIRRRGHKGNTYLIAIYGAYNAMGLIGTEYNGIVILNETIKCVVLDSHMKVSSGYELPTENHIKEVNRIANELTPEDFEQFCVGHERYRGKGI